MLPLTKEELKSHQDLRCKSTLHLRKKYLEKSKNIYYRKVRDHCLYTGNYRSTAHSICNLKFNVSMKFL